MAYDSGNKMNSLIRCMQGLSLEYKELHNLNEVAKYEDSPSALEFLRTWVSTNSPVIFRNAINNWPALTKWNDEYLRTKLKDKEITVAITPTGYADGIENNLFMLPAEKKMTFDLFLEALKAQKPSRVHYIQKQNNNMNEEFECLNSDIDSHISWATEAFGNCPEAANFWMGDERAITSLHQDYYENIYCVIKGRKTFILFPPTDLAWLPYELYNTAIYIENEGGELESRITKEGLVPWISIDPLNPDLNRYPLYKNATPLKCELKAGEILYLPSLWFHHVQQSHGCIAVNYWYNMNFDIKYCYYKFLENIKRYANKD